MARDIAVIVGSIRRESLNHKLAQALARLAPPALALDIVPIGGLALYNPDLDDAPPPAWTAFRARLHKADAVLFVTPEHNRSVPAALKNAVDIASRPYGANVLNAKPAAVVTASPGAIGGFGANHHLRQSLVFLNMAVLAQPEAYLGHVDTFFDAGFAASGKLANAGAEEFLKKFLAAFENWVTATARS